MNTLINVFIHFVIEINAFFKQKTTETFRTS